MLLGVKCLGQMQQKIFLFREQGIVASNNTQLYIIHIQQKLKYHNDVTELTNFMSYVTVTITTVNITL